MSKRIVAKTGTYQKDGQTKGQYARLGVMLNNDKGEYMLLDPSVSLAGVLAKQNVMAESEGKQARDMVMVSIFSDDEQGQQPQQSQPQQQSQQPSGAAGADGFDDDIPFAPLGAEHIA